MSFLYPLGLLGLIAVPVLIIIYIIKNKYTEQTVASTYLWTLSERFLKRKNPLNKIYNLISLILQILAVVSISLSIAHPVFVVPGNANDYCFVLDCSGSMNMSESGVSRMDRAKSKIVECIEKSGNGSTYTLICVGDKAEVLYKQISDPDRAIELLGDASASTVRDDVSTALVDVQSAFEEADAAKVYFMTDKSWKNFENVEIVDVSANENNVALLTADCSFASGSLTVSGKVAAYGKSGEVKISVFVDDSNEASGEKVVTVGAISGDTDISIATDELNADILEKATDYEITCEGVSDYQSVRVVINEKDALDTDNEIVVYNVKHDTSFTTLIVSETPFFLKSALSALGHRQIETVTPDNYEKITANYGLYIFDSYTPSKTPESGSVWYFAVNTVDDVAGFTYQSDSGEHSKRLLTYSDSPKTTVRKLLDGLDSSEIWISKYLKYGYSREFTHLLYCNEIPVLSVGSNDYGNREVVCSFSLHDADLALTFNFVPLINNLLEYTFPSILEKTDYFCGDTAEINVLANTTAIRVVSPSGKEEYLESDSATVEYSLSEAGLYTVIVKMGTDDASASERTLYMFAKTPYSESVTSAIDGDFVVTGEPKSPSRDGVYDDLIILCIILAVIFIADWMVYCYEQYQLR